MRLSAPILSCIVVAHFADAATPSGGPDLSSDEVLESQLFSSFLLSLLLHDPWFAWLHELSQLVVVIDEMLDAKEPATAVDAAQLLYQSRRLISPEEEGTGFARRYFEALQRDPDVVMAHSRMRKVLAALGAE